MTEARQLHEPEVDLSDLEPLVLEQEARVTGNERPLAQTKAPLLDRASNAMMVLFLAGLVAFLLGAAATAAVVLGMLDLKTGWVKEAFAIAKDVVKWLQAATGQMTGD